MITNKDLVENIRFIVNRDDRIMDSALIYDKFVSLIKTPYTGDTQYLSFLEFMRGITDKTTDDEILTVMINNPGYINILKLMNDKSAADKIHRLSELILENYQMIEDDLKYLRVYRKIYSDIMRPLVDNNTDDLTGPEADINGRFIISAFECNSYLNNHQYNDVVNALYEALFIYLFVTQDMIKPNLDIFKIEGSEYQFFNFYELIIHVPIHTKTMMYTRSGEMDKLVEVTRDAVNHIMDFYWMIEPYNRLHIKEYMCLFEPSDEPI